MRAFWASLERWERAALLGALAAGALLRLGYVLASIDIGLAGDEPVYHEAAQLQANEGKWFWSTTPFGVPHESLQKAPVYQSWVGIWYSLLGIDPDKVRAIQALTFSVATIGLGWLLTRRLFGPVAAAAAAAILAVYPNVWQFDVRLFSESVATPLTLLVLLLVIERAPSTRRAAVVGAVMGVSLLVRPSALLLFAGIAVAWWVATGLKRGTAYTAITVGVAALVVAPWTVRNLSVDSEHFVPISIQDVAWYGTFNDDAANDGNLPYKWRPFPTRDADVLRGPPISDGELREVLLGRAREYVRDNPESIPKAFFWNGITRLWDIRRPSHVTDDAQTGNRSRVLAGIGLAFYWPLLALALYGLCRFWRAGRRELVLTVLAIALAASVVYTADAGTRYRAPLEPLVVALACGAVATRVRAG